LTVKETEYCGYYPGVIGKITEVHAVYYNQHWGFDVSFETQEGGELANFIMEFDETRDGLWVAKRNNMFAGSVAIDGRQAKADGARLRWFIVVPVFQGLGIGEALISRAVEFPKYIYGLLKAWTPRAAFMRSTIFACAKNMRSINGGNTLRNKNSN
jgi:GNAT superfamily N-acetyltransferase